MNDQTVWQIVYLFWVIVAFGLVWARLVWAIRRGDRWKKTSGINHHWSQSLEKSNQILLASLQTARKHRDELREKIDRLEVDVKAGVDRIDLLF